MTTRTVAVVGNGAAGVMVGANLVTESAARGVALRVLLIGPGQQPALGVAYSTDDPRHLLNVPAGKMSARIGDPDHFVHWLRANRTNSISPGDFVPRGQFGAYLTDFLRSVERQATTARVEHIRDTVARIGRRGSTGLTLHLRTGKAVPVDAVVLALGALAPGCDWAPDELRESDRFIGDPWAPDALADVPADDDVLIVGTGLTMVDVALALDRPGRVVHAVSRHGLLPRAHNPTGSPPLPPPRIAPGDDLDSVWRSIRRHLEDSIRTHRDWRPAIDSLRPITSTIWRQLTDVDRRRFLTEHSRVWEVLRHRMAPAVAAQVAGMRRSARLRIGKGAVAGVDPGARLRVRLHNGRELAVGTVINCTGPSCDVGPTGDTLVGRLLAAGITARGPLDLGFDTADDGRVAGSGAPVWVIGALRRGNLWETTAFPEIRAQAAEIAAAVLATAPIRVDRPVLDRPVLDRYALPLAATRASAAAYDAALDRILLIRPGADDLLTRAVADDPDFAVGHAALALLGREWGVGVDVHRSLRAARRAVRVRGGDRDRSFVAAVTALAAEPAAAGRAALLRHIDAYPRDALAVSVAVPTIAFGGVTAGKDTWELIERLGPAYGDDWWYLGQLAFVRQDQRRWLEADALVARALAEQPASGHAAHARTHVYYETGEHRAGLRWLEEWLRSAGARTDHAAHFSWHAALHELMLGRDDAVRARYATQLAPPAADGVRVLVDAASLLWRCSVTGAWHGRLPIGAVLDAAPREWLVHPPSAFAAMHAAIALAADGDAAGLDRLRGHADGHASPVFARVIAPLCAGLAAVVEGRWTLAAADLATALRRIEEVGGSAAQREVIEDTLVQTLVSAGRNDDAARILSVRLDRRPSPRDLRHRTFIESGTAP
ncbi:FAD/NAD(P)-binding protein [Actinokineospora sp.]|uniref:FAD/NAD(P)-binding protein n=1 Tax=Actinokineospora sp. TaxID=1872133 RepID=UPI0040381B6D